MALRVIRLIIPSSARQVLKTGATVQTADIHTGPVKNLQYGYLAYVLGERTTPRLTEHSKIICIEGNLASGKGALAQKLADKLGMLYMPEPDVHYVDKITGEPEPTASKYNGNCSVEKFYTDPKAADGNTYRLQHYMYQMRLLYYTDALEHLISTGQGVILERSPYSDMVFMEATYKQGWIRKQCVEHYNEVKRLTLGDLLPPHLVIYVDQAAEEVQKKLKASGKSHLQNVPLAYIKSIEDAYKKTFLPSITAKSEVLAYDTVTAEDVEKVVEDVGNLTFEVGPWNDQDDVSFHHLRMLVQDKAWVANLCALSEYLPEITIGAHEMDDLYYSYASLPGKKYAKGYNADVGDTNILFK